MYQIFLERKEKRINFALRKGEYMNQYGKKLFVIRN